MEFWTFIYPHQLFIDQPAIKKGHKVALIEHPYFFNRLKFHKQKLIFHRATMKDYHKRLLKSGYKTKYVEFYEYTDFIKSLNQCCISILDPIEKELNKELDKLKTNHDIKIIESPMFLTPKDFINDFFSKKNHFSMNSFYIAQRKRMNILMRDSSPVGGKWSYDTENRKSIPKNHSLPTIHFYSPDSIVKEAIEYIKNHFPNNVGSIDFYLPIDHENAELWFNNFLKNRLENFGEYEDAILKEEVFLYHSALSPLLNIGLLTPLQVVEKTITYAENHSISLNSLEGFLRQIIGWREFIKITYDFKGEELEKSNFFNHKKSIPKTFWSATTKITPIDGTIEKILKYAYCHHIERLMIIGNFFLLSEFNPQDIYKWFMELFIDSYDWVMIPNVYAMSQYADGGTITTKPYSSSSNYILKMSNYSKGSWCEIWDALYWNFISKHQKIFAKNPRMTMMIALYNKMDKTKKAHLKMIANNYLKN